MGWFMTDEGFATNQRYVRDWIKFPELRFLDRYDWLVPLALAAALFGAGVLLEIVAPGLGTNGWQMIVWGFFISTVVLYHATYTINSLAHSWGSRRFRTSDDSRNNFFLAVLTLGEGWHNNHHHWPASARQGFYWWEIDLTYYGLRALALTGLIRDLRPVPKRVLEEGRIVISLKDQPRERIAIIGSGVSGLVCAHELHRSHDITLFEAGARIGGHVHTVDVEYDGDRQSIDTGFIVYNELNYPNFTRILRELEVATHASTMSFSVRCDRTGLEYNGTSLNTLFAQRLNLIRPGFHRMVRDILRFNRESPAVLREEGAETVAEYVAAGGYGEAFVEQYLVPMGASIWSCPPCTFKSFPIRFVVEFFANHRMLDVAGRPQWRVISGGSQRYVEAMTRPLRDSIRLSTPVRAVRRTPDHVELTTARGVTETFDHVIFACHSDTALALLQDPSPVERELLGARFPTRRMRSCCTRTRASCRASGSRGRPGTTTGVARIPTRSRSPTT